jgi:hypothetical protein
MTKLSSSARRHGDAFGLGPASWQHCLPRLGVMKTLSAKALRYVNTIILGLEAW